MTWRQRLANAIERLGFASTADLVAGEPATFGPREKWAKHRHDGPGPFYPECPVCNPGFWDVPECDRLRLAVQAGRGGRRQCPETQAGVRCALDDHHDRDGLAHRFGLGLRLRAEGGQVAARKPSDGRYVLIKLTEAQAAPPSACGCAHAVHWCMECGEVTCSQHDCACYRYGDVETR